MGGRALAAGIAAAFQGFLLAALIAGGACAVAPAAAGETPQALPFPTPADTDQDAPSPAAAPPGEDEAREVPATAPAGEDEPQVGPAAAPAGEDGRDPADVTATTAGPEVPAHPIVAAIRSKLNDPELRQRAPAGDLGALEAYYGALTGSPSWITGMGFSAKAQALIGEIEKAGNWGLDPSAFDLPAASDLPATEEAQAIAEIKLALAALKYARFARGGRLIPSRISGLFDQKPNARDPNTILTELASASDPGAYLRALHPKHEQFERLRQTLIKVVAKAKARGIKPERDADVQRLIVNMERWRWMPPELGAYYVWNNIPSFTTRVVKGGKSIYVEKVIVGEVKHPTPIFSAQMNSIVFNPEWTVPETIMLEDLQPRLRQRDEDGTPDLSVLRNNELSVSYRGRAIDAATVDWGRANILSYTFTQAPGPTNVLGVLKFNFPNRHAIYMHDTLQPELFGQTVRTLSHGCIRVREPDRLAALLLKEDKGWSAQRVKDLIAKGKSSAVALNRPVPVHLTYFTIAFDGVGEMRRYGDVYGLDKKMAASLFGKSELLQAEAAPAATKPPTAGRPQRRSAANVGVGRSNGIPGLFGN
ncbi:MAG: L,D-transpeptidase family protein [Methyloceanibacter sp.]|nr:L,D-transpeptidase family protein [Methyloceanibacter sp.]